MKQPILATVLVLTLVAPLAAPSGAQTTLNVRDADIRAFIADAARVTGRTFIIDQRVQGKVTVVTDRPMSKVEYFELFLSTLRANGLVAVPTANGAFRIQPAEGAATQPSRIGSAGANRNALVTEIIRLTAIDAQSALDTVKPLVSPQGSVSANRAANSLVLVDFADNVRRIREVIRRVDTRGGSTRLIALKNASAREVAAALQALASDTPGGGAPGAAGQATQVVPIIGSNSVALRGDPGTVARLASLAYELDRRAQTGTAVRVIFLENADAEQLLPVLQQLVGQAPTQPSPSPSTITPFGATSQGRGSGGGGNGGFGGGGFSGGSGGFQSPSFQQSQTPSSGGGGSGQAAITTEGGRTAAVVTRFSGANAIVIAAPAEVQRQLSEVIRALDTRRQQVLVEAVVAEVSDQTAQQLGAQFLIGSLSGGAFAASTFSNSAPNILTIAGAIGARRLNNTTTTINGSTVTTSTSSAVSDQLAQSAVSSILGATGGFGGVATQIGNTVLGAIVNAVKSDTQSNLLQAPSLVTMDNQEAKILVGQEIPITTGQALSQNFDNQFRTVQRENVGIQLEVRPQVNSSGAIKLFLHQSVSSIAGPVSSNNSDLILNKREVQTTLTVDDGQIAVIAGLLDDNERRTVEKVPFLGNLPVIGNLFKSKAKARTKTNLMVFIRPVILRTAEDSRRLTEQRYGYLRLQDGQQNPGFEPSIDELVRDYMGTTPPLPPAPLPGNAEDPRVAPPVVINSQTSLPVGMSVPPAPKQKHKHNDRADR